MSDDQRITVREILQDIDAAVARMSVSNPHRRLLLQCKTACGELALKYTQLRQLHDAMEEQRALLNSARPAELAARVAAGELLSDRENDELYAPI